MLILKEVADLAKNVPYLTNIAGATLQIVQIKEVRTERYL